MEKRVYNFSAGPSMLPLEVLEQAQRELVCYPSAGMSVMEMSHRSKTFENILEKAKADLKELMHIPDNYKILFLQGGGSTQFAMIPMNLMNKNNKADYVITGQWAKKAAAEAERYGKVNIVASSADSTFDHIPTLDPSKFDPEADYFYITLNNTIYGTRWTELPDTGNVPLVGDMSSSILSQEIDITKFGLLYAGAQKNLGPAGVTVVIVREDLLGNAMDFTPTMLRYDIHAENNSLYNTPPTYGIYFMGLVFDWVKRQGGVAALQKINERKAAILYDFLDQSELFRGTVRSNLLWGTADGQADDARLWAALETAQAADFIRAKQGGLDAPVEQKGRNFSGGQKQRLTIARALVGAPDNLILDDSASALDFATDAALRKALRALPGNPTVFIISQRTSSIHACDLILVLEDGHVAGMGTHTELLETCPLYREIHESQFKGGEAQ